MSDEERWGCGGILYLLVVVGIFWFVGFSLLSEWSGGSHAWWHYVVGVPVGVLFFWLISGGGWRWVAGPFVGGVGMAYLLWKVTTSLDSRSVARESDALGQLAEVVVTVPKDGTGEVAYISAKTRQTLTARSADGKDYKQGTSVKVLKVTDGTAWVTEPSGVGMGTVGSVSAEHPSVGEPIPDRKREH